MTGWNEVLLSALSAEVIDDSGFWIRMVLSLLVMVSSLLVISFCCGLNKLSISSESTTVPSSFVSTKSSFSLSVGYNDSLLFVFGDYWVSNSELFTFWLIG